MKLQRIDKLRTLKRKGLDVPNFKAKLWSSRLMDEVYGRSGFKENEWVKIDEMGNSDYRSQGCSTECLWETYVKG